MSKPRFVGVRFVVMPALRALVIIEADKEVEGMLVANVGPLFTKITPEAAADAIDAAMQVYFDSKGEEKKPWL